MKIHCLHCGAQVKTDGTVCKSCGQPFDEAQLPVIKKHTMKKRRNLIIGIILIIIVAAAASSLSTQNDDQGPNIVVNGGALTPADKQTTEPSSAVTISPTASRTISAEGETLETKYFKVTLESLERLEPAKYSVPADGNEFVRLTLLIENLSDSDYSISSIMMFEAYVDDFSIGESYTAHLFDDSNGTMDGSLAAGKKLRGDLAYEVPIGWNEMEVQIDLTLLKFSNDGQIKIHIDNPN